VQSGRFERIRRGLSALEPVHGGEKPAGGLFAVGRGAFFEIPQELRDRHREVYETLSAYFQQDPAAWDDARISLSKGGPAVGPP
jgi:Mlc titration factor MtfA (ptsG expression regulator)